MPLMAGGPTPDTGQETLTLSPILTLPPLKKSCLNITGLNKEPGHSGALRWRHGRHAQPPLLARLNLKAWPSPPQWRGGGGDACPARSDFWVGPACQPLQGTPRFPSPREFGLPPAGRPPGDGAAVWHHGWRCISGHTRATHTTSCLVWQSPYGRSRDWWEACRY